MATEAESIAPVPGERQTFTGGPFVSVYVDNTEGTADVLVGLGQSVNQNAPFARVRAGACRSYPIPTVPAVSFLIDPNGTAAPAGAIIYWAATDSPASATQTQVAVSGGDVQVSGPVSVQGVSGGTAIGVQVNNQVQAEINTSGGPVEVAQQGTADVSIAAAQVTLDMNVKGQDVTVGVGPAVQAPPFSAAIDLAANGTTQVVVPVPFGLYDEIAAVFYSPSGNMANYTLAANQYRWQIAGQPAAYHAVTQDFTFSDSDDNAAELRISDPVEISPPRYMNEFVLGVTSTVAISETLQVTLLLRYASVGVTNSTTQAIPVAQQGTMTVQGTGTGQAVGVYATQTVTTTVDTSGGAVKVDASGATVPVAQQGTLNVQGVSGGTAIGVQVTETVTTTIDTAGGPVDMSVSDAIIAVGASVAWTAISVAYSVAAAGDSQIVTLAPGSGFAGEYDGFYLRIYSPNSQVPNLHITVDNVLLNEDGLETAESGVVISWRANNNNIGWSNFVPIDPSTVFDSVQLTIENTYQGDTETLTLQVYARYASSRISNATSAPGYTQAASGEFDTMAGTNGGSAQSPNVSTLVASGNYIRALYFGGAVWQANSTSTSTATITLTLSLGGQILAQASAAITSTGTSGTVTLPAQSFPISAAGVANGGVTLVGTVTAGAIDAPSSYSWSPTWATITSATPPQRTATIV